MLGVIGMLAVLFVASQLVLADEGEWQRYEATIEYAAVRADAGYPVGLYVEGYLPVDCDQPLNFEWERRRSVLEITVYVVGPVRECADRRVRFAETLTAFPQILDDLPSGEYRLSVNGYETWVDVPLPVPPTPYPTRTPRPTWEPRPTRTPVPIPTDDSWRAYAVIERVDVIVFESYPMQVRLRVQGYHRTGCGGPTYIEQERVRRTVFVDIYRLVDPRMMCPAILEYFEETIVLRGGFESGTYSFHVNDYFLTLDL